VLGARNLWPAPGGVNRARAPGIHRIAAGSPLCTLLIMRDAARPHAPHPPRSRPRRRGHAPAWRGLALALLLAALGLAAAWPGTARAEGLTAEQAEAARSWKGRYCTPTGCGPAEATTLASVLGFGAAALGAAWVSQRRDRRAR